MKNKTVRFLILRLPPEELDEFIRKSAEKLARAHAKTADNPQTQLKNKAIQEMKELINKRGEIKDSELKEEITKKYGINKRTYQRYKKIAGFETVRGAEFQGSYTVRNKTTQN